MKVKMEIGRRGEKGDLVLCGELEEDLRAMVGRIFEMCKVDAGGLGGTKGKQWVRDS